MVGPVSRLTAAVLVAGQLSLFAAPAFGAGNDCRCEHAADDPTPCPCPLHRGHAAQPDDPPCPMHHAPAPSSEGLHAGCATRTPHLSLSFWFNWEPARVEVEASPVSRIELPLKREPDAVSRRPERPPPRA